LLEFIPVIPANAGIQIAEPGRSRETKISPQRTRRRTQRDGDRAMHEAPNSNFVPFLVFFVPFVVKPFSASGVIVREADCLSVCVIPTAYDIDLCGRSQSYVILSRREAASRRTQGR
jgi:hypothetical protein